MQTEAPAKPPARTFPLWRALLIVIGAVLACFLCLQIIPIPHDNPPVTNEPTWDTPETESLVHRACYDCHSNETTWPWYSYVAPTSWLVWFDVVRGRREMNFSEWQGGGSQFGGRGGRIAERIRQAVSEGEMPPANYLMLHPEAHLTRDERQQLIDGITASLTQ